MKKLIIATDIKRALEKEIPFFNRADVRVFPADSNEKALALHRSIKADLIIAKLDTPEMSGERLCSFIRDDEKLRRVSLIIICSDADPDLERCVQCRANAFFSSPVDSTLLLQEIHKLLHVAPRMSWRSPLSVKIRGKSKMVPFAGHTENISRSGMLFRSSALLFEGDVVTCSFTLPHSAEITADGEIVRSVGKEVGYDSNSYGIRFVNPSSRAVSALSSFLQNRE